MKDKMPILWILVIIVLLGIFIHSTVDGRNKRGWSLSKEEVAFLNHELDRRCAGDCTLTREWYGFRCVTSDGKVYRVFK